MIISWIIKISLIILLFLYIILSKYYLQKRKAKSGVVESTAVNVFAVVVYNVLCYLPMALPSSLQIALLHDPLVAIWFRIFAIVLFGAGIALLALAVIKRKTVGIQDTGGVLYTSGLYSWFRHPIYVGISMNALAVSLLFINSEGLLLYPLILLANLYQARVEEENDMLLRFGDQYRDYRKHTPMFGPLYMWVIIAIVIAAPLVFAAFK